jgi:hypothetical protein
MSMISAVEAFISTVLAAMLAPIGTVHAWLCLLTLLQSAVLPN